MASFAFLLQVSEACVTQYIMELWGGEKLEASHVPTPNKLVQSLAFGLRARARVLEGGGVYVYLFC